MALTKEQKNDIELVLKTSLKNKFKNHHPEPSSMPFHTRLLGKDRLALYSFIHSLNTNFGTTIFEPVALALSKHRFQEAKSHIKAGDFISLEAEAKIQKILNALTTAEASPNKKKELEIIRGVAKKGKPQKVKLTKVDILLRSKEGELFLFDLKTAKPNIGGFREFKRTLLEWAAAVLSQDIKAKVHTLIAIPYNPYEPGPYNRWTLRGMLDLKEEIKVAEEFWDFIGGKGAYQDLLDCFEHVGIELQDEIDQYFKRFNTRKV